MAHIIRSSNVELDAPYELGKPEQDAGESGVGQSDQVRVVESQANYTVLEVVCSCGIKTMIRCEH